MKKFVVLLAITSALLLVNVHFTSASTLNWQSVVGLAPATIGSGFGDSENKGTQAMAVFGGYLYAGTRNTAAGTQIWRTSNGSAWTQVNTSGFGDVNTVSTISFAVFGGFLYAGTRNVSNTGTEIWRTSDGTTWTNVVGPDGTSGNGFGDTNNQGTHAMTVFGGFLYAGTQNPTTGTQVWRTSDGTTWTQANTSGFGDVNNQGTFSMAVFGTYVYAGVGYDNAAQMWRSSDGTTWTQANANPFGDKVRDVDIRCMAVFGNYLYAGTGYNDSQVWRSADGTSWSNVVGPDGTVGYGFGNTRSWSTHTMNVFGGYLYVGTDGDIAQIWRTSDGITWTQAGTDGFGDPNSWAMESAAVFDGYLYVGAHNESEGTQVWRVQQEPSSPVLQPGQPGLPYTGGGPAPSASPGRLGILLPIALAGFAALVLGSNVLQRRQANARVRH